MRCEACGVEAPAESTFCPKCGTRLDQAADSGAAGAKPANTVADRFRGAMGPGESESESEQTLWTGGYSAKAMIGGWVIAGLVTAGLVVLMVLYSEYWLLLAAAVGVLWAGTLLVLAYEKLSVYYELTNHRFIHKLGILTRVADRIELIHIDDVSYRQGLIQRAVGVGTIAIHSSDTTHPELVLKGIADVKRIADAIDDARRMERRRRGLHIESI